MKLFSFKTLSLAAISIIALTASVLSASVVPEVPMSHKLLATTQGETTLCAGVIHPINKCPKHLRGTTEPRKSWLDKIIPAAYASDQIPHQLILNYGVGRPVITINTRSENHCGKTKDRVEKKSEVISAKCIKLLFKSSVKK